MDEKFCILCKHFYLDLGAEGYSEVTPGQPAEIGCKIGVWLGVPGDGQYTEQKFLQDVRIARTCEKFSPARSEER